MFEWVFCALGRISECKNGCSGGFKGAVLCTEQASHLLYRFSITACNKMTVAHLKADPKKF